MKGTRASEGDRNKWENLALLLRKAGERIQLQHQELHWTPCSRNMKKHSQESKQKYSFNYRAKQMSGLGRSCRLQLSEHKDTQRIPAGSGTTSIKFLCTQRLSWIGGKAPMPKKIRSQEQNYCYRLVQHNGETQKAVLTTSFAILLKKKKIKIQG